MFNDDYDDRCVFTLTDSMWIQRITAESLEFGQDWEDQGKRKTTARLLRESSASNEQYLKKGAKIKVLPVEESKAVKR